MVARNSRRNTERVYNDAQWENIDQYRCTQIIIRMYQAYHADLRYLNVI